MTWKRLDPDNSPEPNSYLFCNKCGLKNRGDDNWVYRDDPENGLVQNLRRQIQMIPNALLINSMIKIIIKQMVTLSFLLF